MIGDLGGVTEIVMLMFGFFMFPISEFSFNIKAMKKWFLLNTSKENLVEKCDNLAHDCINSEIHIPKHINIDIKRHKKIRVSMMDQYKLYCFRNFKCLFCTRCWMKKDKLNEMYEKGLKKLE